MDLVDGYSVFHASISEYTVFLESQGVLPIVDNILAHKSPLH